MSEERKYTLREGHQNFAVTLFNHVWELLEKESRTREDDDRMVHTAHASRFHWGEIGEPRNLAVGEWQISRVYATLKRAESALRHARRCLEIIRENDIRGFFLASAYEGMARAYSVAGERKECGKYIDLAKAEGKLVEDKEDRDLLFSQLREIPEYRE